MCERCLLDVNNVGFLHILGNQVEINNQQRYQEYRPSILPNFNHGQYIFINPHFLAFSQLNQGIT